jgi:hypothetical protein
MNIYAQTVFATCLFFALLVATASAESMPDTPDQFAGDPFAVLGTQSGEASDEPHRPPRIKTEGSMFFRSIFNNLRQESRINPGNRAMQLEEQRHVLESRLTLSDHLDQAQQWRWLFKGFASNASYRDQDGVLRDEARTDELFVDWKGEGWFANLGKRRINWGHAQGFNPVNVVVPPRDPANPGLETEGQPMLWVNRVSGADAVDVIATRNYERNYTGEQNRWGGKWSHAAAKSDYAIYYFDGAPYLDGRSYEQMLGGSFSADVFPGVTVYMEAARFSNNYRSYYDTSGTAVAKNAAYWQAVAGSALNLGGKRRIGVEFYRNEQGYSETERLNYFQAVDQQLASGLPTGILRDYKVTGMNRDYLLLSFQDEWRERYTLDLSALVAADSSYALRAQANYAISDYYELLIVLLHNGGTRDTEFGNNPLSKVLEFWIGANF